MRSSFTLLVRLSLCSEFRRPITVHISFYPHPLTSSGFIHIIPLSHRMKERMRKTNIFRTVQKTKDWRIICFSLIIVLLTPMSDLTCQKEISFVIQSRFLFNISSEPDFWRRLCLPLICFSINIRLMYFYFSLFLAITSSIPSFARHLLFYTSSSSFCALAAIYATWARLDSYLTISSLD